MSEQGGWRAWLRRRDSLFARMLLIQATLAASLTMLYVGLYAVERNRTLSIMMADHWAPALAQAAGLAPRTGPPPLPEVMVRAELPEDTRHLPALTPRVQALKNELRARGIPVEDIAMDRALSNDGVWLLVRQADGRRLWMGVQGPLVALHEFGRLLMGLSLGLTFVFVLAWFPARNMTRRLARLRLAIRSGERTPPAPQDITTTPEIYEIEQAYNALVEQVQRQQRERALMLAGISHDLRSPLGRIRMAAELLPDDPALAPRRQAIVGNVQAANRLIESFLDLVRSAELPIDQPVDVADAARRVAAGFERPADELQVEVPDVVELPEANEHLIERALFNLIDNALHHGATPVVVRVHEDGEALFIEVLDHGPGVPEHQRAQLLQAFARGDASRGKTGSGLGLAVVQQVATRLRGDIHFEQTPGRWKVQLRFPMLQQRRNS
jgi:two-component system osmolarity sensor histidine kinase EnvZ